MKKLLPAMLLLLAAAAFFWYQNYSPKSLAPEESGTVKAGQPENSNTVAAEENSISQTPHPVSLPAFMEKTFNGSSLTLKQKLDSNNAYTRYHITYKSGDLTISGIMNIPAGSGPFPVLILNHGYIDPAVYTNGRGLKREQDYFARRGFAVLHPDYRNHAQSDKDEGAEANIRLGYVEDVINAVLAVKNSGLNYLDTERIGMLGHSMGGGITQGVLVTKPDLVDAAVLFAPVSMDARDSYYRWTESRPEVVEKIKELYGAPDQNEEFWDNVSPINFISEIKSPIQIHHGTKDDDVPLEWSERTHKALQDAGKTVTLFTYEGQPHEFTTAWTTVMQRSEDFFRQNLR